MRTKTMILLQAALAAVAMPAAAIAATPFEVRYEGALPGQQNASTTFSAVGIEDFDALPTGFSTFISNFGTAGLISGSYSNVQINPADQYGGAFGGGNYAVSFSTYSLDITTTIPRGANFFGYWLSALDGGNEVSFYSGGRLLFVFKPSDVLAAVSGNPAFYSNPNAPFTGQNPGEPYIFLSFYSNSRSFDRIVFNQTRGGGYESDNHTVGRFTGPGTGTLIPLLDSSFGNVPEPGTWAMLICGFGLVGAVARRRRALAA